MGRQRSFTKTNGIKKTKIAISLWTIPQGKRTSLKSHAKPDQ